MIWLGRVLSKDIVFCDVNMILSRCFICRLSICNVSKA